MNAKRPILTLAATALLTGVLLAGALLTAALAASHEGGKELYTAKCASCHGADGTKTIMSKPVKGIKAETFGKIMSGYKAKTYGGTKKGTMEKIAEPLSDADIKALAIYIGTL